MRLGFANHYGGLNSQERSSDAIPVWEPNERERFRTFPNIHIRTPHCHFQNTKGSARSRGSLMP